MGQQLRVRIKRKRRVAYLRRKNAARRAAATRSTPNQTTGTERIRSVGVIDIINTSLQRGDACSATDAAASAALLHSGKTAEAVART